MRTWTKYALPCAGILAIAASGCATGRKTGTSNPAAAGVQTSQRETEQALDDAKKAQEKASEEQKRAAQAQQDVREEQRKLQEAQARAEQEAGKARQAQEAANQATQQSTRSAAQSQAAAAQQLEHQQQLVSRGEQVLSGQVQRATRSEIVVQPQGGDSMTIAVTPATRVQIDGRQASAGEIKQGAEARVSFDATRAQPTAALVQVVTGNPAGATRTGAGTGATEHAPGSDSGATGTGTGTPEPTR